jgi:outer membrane protein assembly factor BamB
MCSSLRNFLVLIFLVGLLTDCSKWKVSPYDLLPQVETGAATTSGATSIQAGAKIVALGPNSLQEFGIVYSSTNQQPTTADTKITATGSGSATVALSSLQPNTTYYYRAYATNDKALTGYGETKTFKTGEVIPVVETLDPIGTATTTSAQVQCQITNASAISLKEYGIVYSATNQLPTAADGVSKATGTGANTTVTLSNLTPNTTYYYRAYVVTSSGTVYYGPVKTVKTAEAAAAVETLDPVGTPASTSAQVQCRVNNAATISLKEYGVVYSFTTTQPTTADGVAKATGSGELIAVSISGLQPGTTYNYRAYAITGSGTVYGATKTFTTATVSIATLPVIYIGGQDGNVYAVNANTGEQIWSFAAKDLVVSSPMYADGVIYVGSRDGNVYALDALTGKQKWAFATGGNVPGCPTVANGLVYVGSYDKKMYAINASNGTKKWEVLTGGTVESSPAIWQNKAFFGSGDGKFYVVDANTGATIRAAVSIGTSIRSSPTISNTLGIVYVGSDNGNLYAFDGNTGTQKWAFKTAGAVDSSPVLTNSLLYVGSRDHKLHALDPLGGKESWSFDAGADVYSSPAALNGTVYVGSDNYRLFALDGDKGTKKWEFVATHIWVSSSPVVVNDMVIVGSWDGHLYSINTADGKQRWAFPKTGVIKDGINGTVVVVQNGAIIGSYPSISGAVN